MMTEAEELDAILEVFTSEGWKFIMNDMKVLYDQIDSLHGITTSEQFYKRQGEVERLGWFLNLEDWYRFTQENQDNDKI